jgi:hypothetical protein
MGGVEATVDGLDRFVETLADAAEQLADLDTVNREAGALVVAAVEAPRLTGALASTVAAVADRDGFTLTAGGPAVPYAAIVHARNPFLTRALDDEEQRVTDLYTDHVTDTVNTIQGA